MKTRINKIRRKLTTSINKLERRSNIQDYIKQNHKNKINDINISLITLELQVQDLQHTINKYLNTKREDYHYRMLFYHCVCIIFKKKLTVKRFILLK